MIRLPLWARLSLAGTAIFAAFVLIASALFLTGTGLWGVYNNPWPLAWPEYLIYARDDSIVWGWLEASAMTAGVLVLVIAGIAWRLWRARDCTMLTGRRSGRVRPVERGVTDNLGHSDWRSLAATRQLFPGGHPLWGGIAVAEEYRVDLDPRIAGRPFAPRNPRTWGQGGRTPLLIDPCIAGSGHSIIFAGSGAYKSTSALTSVLTWTGSSVVLDPSTELGPMLDGALKRQRKQVFHIGIPDESKPIRMTGFNVLSWIDPSHPEAELHVRSVVAWIYDEAAAVNAGRPEDPFFAPMGKLLVTACLAHFCWSNSDPDDITLGGFIQVFNITEKDMLALLAGIRASSRSPMARRMATSLMECEAEETFSGVFLNAVNGIQWLFTEAYAEFLSIGDFDPRALLLGRTTVFLNISLRTLENTPAIARVLVGSLLNTIVMADGWTRGKILFLLDEAARLGHLAALETARDTGRKYGVVLHMLWQSIGQMHAIWHENGTQAWIDAASWIGYAAIRAGGAGKNLSDELGTYPVLARSEGENQGRSKPYGINFSTVSRGRNLNLHEIKRALMSAAELQQDLREDEIIIVPASGMPIRASRPIWFRRAEMVAQIENATNRFATIADRVGG